MRLTQSIRKRLLARLLPQPVLARHAEYSMLFSADDESAPPTPQITELALDAARCATKTDLSDVSARMTAPPYVAEIWPGELYKFLAGITQVLRPMRVLEVGTCGGTSTLSMLKYLDAQARLVTFDIVPWTQIEGCLLREEDFNDGRLVQHIDDLSEPEVFEKHRAMIEQADMIFLDASKDGVFEQKLLDAFETVRFEKRPVLVFDDIRLWNMLGVWRRLPYTKLDVTSFGHWAGTGIAFWGERPSGT